MQVAHFPVGSTVRLRDQPERKSSCWGSLAEELKFGRGDAKVSIWDNFQCSLFAQCYVDTSNRSGDVIGGDTGLGDAEAEGRQGGKEGAREGARGNGSGSSESTQAENEEGLEEAKGKVEDEVFGCLSFRLVQVVAMS